MEQTKPSSDSSAINDSEPLMDPEDEKAKIKLYFISKLLAASALKMALTVLLVGLIMGYASIRAAFSHYPCGVAGIGALGVSIVLEPCIAYAKESSSKLSTVLATLFLCGWALFVSYLAAVSDKPVAFLIPSSMTFGALAMMELTVLFVKGTVDRRQWFCAGYLIPYTLIVGGVLAATLYHQLLWEVVRTTQIVGVIFEVGFSIYTISQGVVVTHRGKTSLDQEDLWEQVDRRWLSKLTRVDIEHVSDTGNILILFQLLTIIVFGVLAITWFLITRVVLPILGYCCVWMVNRCEAQAEKDRLIREELRKRGFAV